jgi:predicted RNase H-like nuclease (RuvC/YqgF family)
MKNKTLIIFGIGIISVIALIIFFEGNGQNQAGAGEVVDYFQKIQVQSEKINLNELKTKEQEQAIEQAQKNIKTLESQKKGLDNELKDITNQCLSDLECSKKLEAGQKASKTIEK